ncbi:zinc finger BED domain-containing 4-like, partial [Brachionus plicatilis]
SKTALAIRTSIDEVLIEWNIESKVEFISTDNALNICKAVSESKEEIIHVRCLGHLLNLVVKKVLEFEIPNSHTSTQPECLLNDEDEADSSENILFSSEEVFIIEKQNNLLKI